MTDLDTASVELLRSNPAFLEHALKVRRDFGFDALRHLIQSVLVCEGVALKAGAGKQRIFCKVDITWPLKGRIAHGAEQGSIGHEVRS